jgi:hypothetical protein
MDGKSVLVTWMWEMNEESNVLVGMNLRWLASAHTNTHKGKAYYETNLNQLQGTSLKSAEKILQRVSNSEN